MRPILFRGYCPDVKKWVEGDLIHGVKSKKGQMFILPEDINQPGCHHLDGFEVTPSTVAQFTGLYDSVEWGLITDVEKKEWLSSKDSSGKLNTADTWPGRKVWEGSIVLWNGRELAVYFDQERPGYYVELGGMPERLFADRMRYFKVVDNPKPLQP